jgi:hypothetical protein
MITKTVSMPHAPETLYHVEIIKNASIRIYGDDNNTRREPTPFDKTFQVGDWAEYDSYNLRYIGQIIAIGENTVTIQKQSNRETDRLSLAKFAWRNDDFDMARIERYNAEEMMCI